MESSRNPCRKYTRSSILPVGTSVPKTNMKDSTILPLQVSTMLLCNCTKCFSQVLLCLCRSIQCYYAIVFSHSSQVLFASAGLYNAIMQLYSMLLPKYYYASAGLYNAIMQLYLMLIPSIISLCRTIQCY